MEAHLRAAQVLAAQPVLAGTTGELVAEIRAGMSSDGGLPSAELANQAVQVAVTGAATGWL
jgi:hypothetical protein